MLAKDHLGREFKSFSAMCRAYGIEVHTALARLNRGLSIKEALTRGLWSRAHTINGHTYNNVKEICRTYDISKSNMNYRIYDLGLSLEEAVNKK